VHTSIIGGGLRIFPALLWCFVLELGKKKKNESKMQRGNVERGERGDFVRLKRKKQKLGEGCRRGNWKGGTNPCKRGGRKRKNVSGGKREGETRVLEGGPGS